MRFYQALGFAGGLAAAVAGYASASPADQKPRKASVSALETAVTEADRKLAKFPTSIPGARNVDKYPTQGAKRVLVHVRQVHEAPDFIAKMFPDKKDEVDELLNVQQDIYSILSYLLQQRAITPEIYLEGTDERIARSMNQYYEMRREDVGFATMSESMMADARRRKEDPDFNALCEALRVYGALRLANERRIIFRGAEYLVANDRAMWSLLCSEIKELSVYQSELDLIAIKFDVAKLGSEIKIKKAYEDCKIKQEDPKTWKELYEEAMRLSAKKTEKTKEAEQLRRESTFARERTEEAVLDAREDILLNIASQNPGMMHTTIYGAGHDWRNNVEKWNKEHPDKKYSLIVITPQAIPEDKTGPNPVNLEALR